MVTGQKDVYLSPGEIGQYRETGEQKSSASIDP